MYDYVLIVCLSSMVMVDSKLPLWRPLLARTILHELLGAKFWFFLKAQEPWP